MIAAPPTVQAILESLEGVTETNNGWQARCPAHDDNKASLSVSEKSDGTILMKCHAGCSTSDVVSSLGLTLKDLFPPSNGNGKGKIVATYNYHDLDGKLLYQAVRFDPKDFRQRAPDGHGGWVWKLNGVSRVLYRLPELLASDPAKPVFIPEGEKDVDRLIASGQLATCNIGGAGKWKPEYSEHLRGRHVIIIVDCDEPGRKHGQQVAKFLHGVAKSVRVVELPDVPDHGDVSDFLDAGGTVDALMEIARGIVVWKPDVKPPRARVRKPSTRATVDGKPLAVHSREGQTDIANARRFVERYGERVRYCHPWRAWLAWDGTRWAMDDTGNVMRWAKHVAQDIFRQALKTGEQSGLHFAAQTANERRLTAMLALAQCDVPILPAEMDSDPWALNCPNGTLDLRTGELREHRRDDFITKLCPTPYNSDAETYLWDRFLESIFDGRQSLVDFLQRLFGYCLTGDVREQILPIFWGSGSNGKSTLIEAYMDAIGGGYVMKAVADLLMQKRNDSHPTERADLFGKRFVACIETGDGRRLNESLVKELTGGDRIRARWMRKNFFEFSPTHKVVLLTNHKPVIRGIDHAIWRRIALLPFTVQFWNPEKGESGPPELKQDKSMPRKLAEARDGILAWAVQGCLDWQRNGLILPAEVRAATDEYRSGQDIIGRFIRDCCIVAPAVRMRFKDWYAALETWCSEGGDNLPSRKATGEYLKERYREHSYNGRWYIGIGLGAEKE